MAATAPKKKTTQKIQYALVKLLEASPMDDITVTALCDAAGINRATFYYHYDSVSAVFDELESSMEREFNQFLSQSAISVDGRPEKSFYVLFFEFVARNAPVCRMILNSSHGQNSSFVTRALESGRYKVTGLMTQIYPDCPAQKINMYYLFVSGGFLNLLRYWLNNGMKESIAEISGMGEQLAWHGSKFLEKQ